MEAYRPTGWLSYWAPGGSPRREPSNPQARALDCMMTRPNELGLYHHYHLTPSLMLPTLLTHVTAASSHVLLGIVTYAVVFAHGDRLPT